MYLNQKIWSSDSSHLISLEESFHFRQQMRRSRLFLS